MTILRGLIEKELRQHAVSFTVLLMLMLCGLALLATNRFMTRFSGTELEAFAMLLRTLIPIASLTLGHVLVTGEYRQRTQLFLEGLPLPRWRFLALKYALGLSFTLMIGGITLVVVLGRIWEREAMNGRFVEILAMKSVAWIFFLHALFFAYAFLGRYRWVAAGGALILLVNLSQFGLAVNELSPLRLMDGRFAYDRHELPWADVAWTALAGVLLTIGAFSLGLMRDSTVASLLAERMSARERSVITVLALCALLGTGTVIEKRSEISPVHLPGAMISEQPRVTVTVAAAVDRPSAAEVAVMKALGAQVAADLQAFAEYLTIEKLPPVFIVYRRDFAADRLENGDLKPEQGLLVRTNLLAKDFRADALRRSLIHHLLQLQTAKRLDLERNAWLLDGIPRWWQERQPESGGHAITPAIAKEAAGKAKFSGEVLRKWLSVRKDVGSEPAQHLAATGLRTLEQLAGEEGMRRFLSAFLSRPATKDARTWFRELIAPWPALMDRETGVGPERFISEWRQQIDAAGSLSVTP
ncbi:MAG: ABC transporter permease [Chthoniobacteraceae bacterium]